MAETTRTTVHVVRHGEVHNPDQVLYGRLPDFHLSDRGRRQAQSAAEWLAGHDVTYVVASPLERAQETAAPIAATHGLDVDVDGDLIESWNQFEGEKVAPGDGALRDPRNWPKLRNPRRPSWGEPYTEVAARMTAALHRARTRAAGHEAVCVSHQLPVETLRAAEKLYGVPVLEGYGLSENAGACFFNPVDAPTRPGTVGRPVDGFEFRIVAMDGTEVPEEDLETSGELRIRGEGIMAGYWGRPEDTEAAFDEDGWFRTGDIARRDEAGYVMIVDRLKDVIIRGGMNVYPREVEEVLYEHPDVVEAAVVGVPDERLGEEIAAFVSLAPGSAVTGEELQAFAAERLARYKQPREVTVLDGLPKNATGKILRRELRQG